jgi:hypothetical protein
MIYDIEKCPPKVLKVSLDYNLYVFLVVILLNHVLIPGLVSCPEYLLVTLTLSFLNRTLITLHIHSLLLLC